MKTVFGNAAYFDFMLRNLSLLRDTCDTAAKISAAQTYVARVEILNPYLTRVAPAADELSDLINSGRRPRASATVLKKQILEKLASERLDPTIDVRIRNIARDNKWLEQGKKFFERYILPLLIAELQKQLLGSH